MDNQIEFEYVYKKYAAQIYRYLIKSGCNPQDAEDITQDTFVKAMLHIDQYKGKGKMSVWLCQIAKNIWYNLLKKIQKK